MVAAMQTVKMLVAGLVSVALVVPALAAVKASDVPPLIKQLHDKDPKNRAAAAKELGHIGSIKKSLVKEAVPDLIDAAKDSDINVKIEVYASLGHIGADPEKVVPILVESLKSKDQKLVVGAAQALGYYGPAAEDALPELKKVAEDNQVPRNNKEAEAKFTREELQKRRTIGRAVGDAMRNIGGGKKK
jgi:HEAT repeat protein